MPTHTNNGECQGCISKFEKYPGFYLPLRLWFEELQKRHPEAHISCAGRGRIDQDALYIKRLTKARFGRSAHNWNAAIDIFCNNGSDIYPLVWFKEVIEPQIPDYITWYGKEGSAFYELPHFEIKDWQKLADALFLSMVKEQ